MSRFAPVTRPLGLHWHPYADNVLQPILHLPDRPAEQGESIVVYLPFEDQQEITRLLQQFPQHQFRQYASGLAPIQAANVLLCPTSTSHFKRDLAGCTGVICNSGFELISECLQWRKPVLTRPLQGQIEQLSNARALGQLGYATVMSALCPVTIGHWLAHRPKTPVVSFPDVAAYLALWLVDGAPHEAPELRRQLWPGATATGIGQLPQNKVA
ncbi:MAG TPA: glycosyltransferase family protein, partial [Kineobactrum sp.]